MLRNFREIEHRKGLRTGPIIMLALYNGAKMTRSTLKPEDRRKHLRQVARPNGPRHFYNFLLGLGFIRCCPKSEKPIRDILNGGNDGQGFYGKKFQAVPC